jgi:hypothetical protein
LAFRFSWLFDDPPARNAGIAGIFSRCRKASSALAHRRSGKMSPFRRAAPCDSKAGHLEPVFDQEATMRAFTVIAALLFALATLSMAAAEPQTTARSDAQKKEDQEIDAAYRNATRGSGPTSAAKVDPWGKVRPAETDKKPK